MLTKCLTCLMIAALAGPWQSGCEGPAERRWVAKGQAITNGELDNRPAHHAVVALASNHSFCSGTLIAPRVVLTAAHCADGDGPEDYTVYFGTYMDSGISRAVAEVLVHPDYDDGGDFLPPVNDLALMLLADGPPPGVTPIPHLPAHLAISDYDIGRPLEFVGFGQTEDGTSGVRMTVDNNLGWVCTTPGGCAIGPAWAVNNSLCQDQRPGGPCSGDSGGPAFVLRGGLEYVAGVTSYGDEDCIRFGCSTKADAFDLWIEAFKAGRLGADCTLDSDCHSGFCAAGVCCDRACGGACQSCSYPGFLGSCVPLADGVDCGDDDVCNGIEICQAGACLTGAALDCDDGNPCTADECNPYSGCLSETLADGQTCAGADLCQGLSRCQGGACVQQEPLICDDGDPCTEDICLPQTGCRFQALADGQPCGSGACGPAQCQGGLCRMSDPPDCDDGNPCTEDDCDPQAGCTHAAIGDGTVCGECLMCINAECVSKPECGKSGGCGCAAAGGESSATWLTLVVAFLFWTGRRRTT